MHFHPMLHCMLTSKEYEIFSKKHGKGPHRTSSILRRLQILTTLLACGPTNIKQLSRIIGSYTGEKSEVVRQSIYRNLTFLTDSWLVERRSKQLIITPLGIFILIKDKWNNSLVQSCIREWAARRLEEQDSVLAGLSLLLEQVRQVEEKRWSRWLSSAVRLGKGEEKLPSENYRADLKEALYIILNMRDDEYSVLMESRHRPLLPIIADTPRDMLETLFFEVLSNYDTPRDLFNEWKQLKRSTLVNGEYPDLTPFLKEKFKIIDKVISNSVRVLAECSKGSCSSNASEIFMELFKNDLGLLSELTKLNTEVIRKLANSPGDNLSPWTMLSLVVAGHLLSSVSTIDLLEALPQIEEKASKLLLILLIIDILDRLRWELFSLGQTIKILNENKSFVLSRLEYIKDEGYRKLVLGLMTLSEALRKLE